MGFEDFQFSGPLSLPVPIGPPASSASEPLGVLQIYHRGISISNRDGGGILLYDPNGLRIRSPPLPVPVSVPPIYASFRASFLFAYNVALEAEDDRKVVFICHRSRIESAPPFLSQGIQPSSDIFKRIQMKYVEDDEGIKKYFAAFHLHDTFPLSVVVDDFGDFFYERKCQERYGNPRGRDLAMVRILALCHNAVVSSNDKGHCKVLISDTHHGDSPRLLFLYKRWVPSIFTIKGDGNGSFLLKSNSSMGSDNTEKMKIAKYSLVLQRLLLEGIVDDEETDNHAVVGASVEQLIPAK